MHEMEPTRMKKRGRPKLTCVEGIRGLVRGKGLMEEDGMTKATGGRR